MGTRQILAPVSYFCHPINNIILFKLLIGLSLYSPILDSVIESNIGLYNVGLSNNNLARSNARR